MSIIKLYNQCKVTIHLFRLYRKNPSKYFQKKRAKFDIPRGKFANIDGKFGNLIVKVSHSASANIRKSS